MDHDTVSTTMDSTSDATSAPAPSLPASAPVPAPAAAAAAAAAAAGAAPVKSEAIQLSLHLERSAYAASEQHVNVGGVLSLHAPQFEAKVRAPLDMVLVVDTSGSMSGPKIKLAKETLQFVVRHLRSQDHLGLVTYASNVQVALPLMAMTKDNKAQAQRMIQSIQANGGTNLSGGLFEAMDMMARRTSPNSVASVLLMTDGQANEGVTSTEGILSGMAERRGHAGPTSPFPPVASAAPVAPAVSADVSSSGVVAAATSVFSNFVAAATSALSSLSMSSATSSAAVAAAPNISSANTATTATTATTTTTATDAGAGADAQASQPAKGSGYSVYTFGFGDDHNSALLKSISDQGSGMYYYIKTAESIPSSFGDCLGGLMSVVAQNMELRMEALAGATLTKLHTTKPHTIAADGRSARVEYGDMQSEEAFDLLFDMTLPVWAPSTAPDAAAGASADAAAAAAAAAATTANIAHCRCELHYFNVITSNMDVSMASVEVDRPAVCVDDGVRNEKIERQRMRVMAADAITEAQKMADTTHDFAGARRKLETTMETMRTGHSRDHAYTRELLDDVQRCRDTLESAARYRDDGTHVMSSCAQTHYNQRSNLSSHSRGYVSYTTSSKAAWRGMASKKDADGEEE